MKTKRTGRLTCGICGKEVVKGKFYFGFFCADSNCQNSEDKYTN